jgi:UDP-N-acetylglucosamine 4,6-dehydratase
MNRSSSDQGTRYAIFRWGNVIGSRGSAIPKFVSALNSAQTLTVTDPEMTRFWIRIEDAVDFMIRRQFAAAGLSPQIPPMKAASVQDVIETLAEILGVKGYTIKVVGNRGGEKKHEFVTSQHSEEPVSSETAPRYSKEELVHILKPFCGVTG